MWVGVVYNIFDLKQENPGDFPLHYPSFALEVFVELVQPQDESCWLGQWIQGNAGGRGDEGHWIL